MTVMRTAPAFLLILVIVVMALGPSHVDAGGQPSRLACPGYAPDLGSIGAWEVRGVITGGRLWALLFYAPPAPALTEVKIVIRMTGSGPFHVRALGPRGGRISPVWGPEAHGGSNWNRPGDEWGTGWKFRAPGCWRLHARRSHLTGDIWLQVVVLGR
jgi:hypothetical protein